MESIDDLLKIEKDEYLVVKELAKRYATLEKRQNLGLTIYYFCFPNKILYKYAVETGALVVEGNNGHLSLLITNKPFYVTFSIEEKLIKGCVLTAMSRVIMDYIVRFEHQSRQSAEYNQHRNKIISFHMASSRTHIEQYSIKHT